MLGLLRVLIFEWILARLASRWVVGGLLLAGGALVFFVGIPLLLVLSLLGWWIWRKLRTAPGAPATGVSATP